MMNNLEKRKICHLTIVHNRYDPRILEKQCVSLARHGFDVTLLVSDNLPNEVYKNVQIMSIGNLGKRLNLKIIQKVFLHLKKENYEIFQFHDPELIFIGILIKLTRRIKIIYDVHEDYLTAVNHKKLNVIYKTLFKLGLSIFESISKWFFKIIIAEKYYKYRFPKSISILNYPIIENDKINIKRNYKVKKLIYTGNVTTTRGAFIHANIVNQSDKYSIYFVGKCNDHIYQDILNTVKSDSSRIHFEGIDTYIPFNIIKKRYQEDWLAGLAIFPETDHYREKELTKFFEYMYYGIPVICSNFKVWRELIEENNCGICVDPNNVSEIVEAIDYLYNNQYVAEKMGANGRKLVQNRYNWKIEEMKLITLYQNL